MSTESGGAADDLITIRLLSGRSISCNWCVVTRTYEAFFCREPGEQANKAMFDSLFEEARRVFGDVPVHVLSPPKAASDDYPKIRVSGYFKSPAIREVTWCSHLILAWFQESACPLVDASNMRRLSEVEWDSLARDCEL
jgi:hypothetical protein